MADKYYIDAPTYLEVTSEIADYVMKKMLPNIYDSYTYEEQGSISFTEEGQEVFNKYLEEIEDFFSNANIVREE